MVLPRETIHLGADPNCSVCKKPFEFKVMQSAAGYYIGTQCCEGPNSRESIYYPTRESAQEDLDNNVVMWRE